MSGGLPITHLSSLVSLQLKDEAWSGVDYRRPVLSGGDQFRTNLGLYVQMSYLILVSVRAEMLSHFSVWRFHHVRLLAKLKVWRWEEKAEMGAT